MIIYLDFDGTVVEHQYPLVGRVNPGSFMVIEKLANAGHDIILNTMRSNFEDNSLEMSIEFMNNYPYSNFVVKSWRSNKLLPSKWERPSTKMTRIFIDDIADNIPMRDGFHEGSYMVNWAELDRIFEETGLYNCID
jgi:hypothetical protein